MSDEQIESIRREIRGYLFKVAGGVILMSLGFAGWMTKVAIGLDAAERDRLEMHEVAKRQSDLNQYFVAHVASLEARQK